VRRLFYTADVPSRVVQLNDNEIKMLLVAIRQVQHTFTIAESQSVAAGEPLAQDYDSLREAYAELQNKLAALTQDQGPRLVK
jgi:hypothetical protein